MGVPKGSPRSTEQSGSLAACEDGGLYQATRFKDIRVRYDPELPFSPSDVLCAAMYAAERWDFCVPDSFTLDPELYPSDDPMFPTVVIDFDPSDPSVFTVRASGVKRELGAAAPRSTEGERREG